MTAEAVKELLNSTPFVPFSIHLPDRPSMRVPHPDFAHVSPKGKTMVVYTDSGEGFRVLDMQMITELEPDPVNP